jgi:ABC-2 family transporter
MRALWKMTLVEAKLFLREPMAVFFTLAFPLMVLLLFGTIFGAEPIPGTNLKGIDMSAPAYTGMIIGTVGLIGLPTTLAGYQELGILRRLRATPLHPSTILGAQVIVNLLTESLPDWSLRAATWSRRSAPPARTWSKPDIWLLPSGRRSWRAPRCPVRWSVWPQAGRRRRGFRPAWP